VSHLADVQRGESFVLRRTLSLAAASVVAVAATTVLASSPAMASDSEHKAFTDESSSIGSAYAGGYLQNVEHGDYVTLCDNDADGYGVYLDVLVGNTWKYTLHAAGVDDCDHANADDGYSSHNLPESASITFSMYLYKSANGGTITGNVVKTWYNDH
jgi:hypothetical protein